LRAVKLHRGVGCRRVGGWGERGGLDVGFGIEIGEVFDVDNLCRELVTSANALGARTLVLGIGYG
jgi:hypothetical protein